MASKTVKVGSSVGLHARPASIIADAAGEFDEDIFLSLVGEEDDDNETDAASSLMIMAFGAEQGDEVTVTSDNEEAVEKIAGLIEQDLDAS
ncbi:HPr family phosphocarrier protein [Corynebacterium sp. KPL3927]|uniref:HPr family phosphocarrier protein n=1 Tax=Corynebacterium sp. KPL3927 TaxID=3158324 RepID=UPI0032EB4E6C